MQIARQALREPSGVHQYLSVFRMDRKNVGDLWSVPARFFSLNARTERDLISDQPLPNLPGMVIVGGGGLGRKGFDDYLRKLARPDRKYRLIAWGVGADSLTVKGGMLPGPQDMASLLSYFDGFDAIGTRIHSADGYGGDARFSWVPCASCMSPLFDELRSIAPREGIGVYEHLREPVMPHLAKGNRIWNKFFPAYPVDSNRGSDLRAKLAFLARFETIVTNSYHGVYWATLLNRKVVCLPFKNGLFSFRHSPAYFGADGLRAALDRARSFPDALSECRDANTRFRADMEARFGPL